MARRGRKISPLEDIDPKKGPLPPHLSAARAILARIFIETRLQDRRLKDLQGATGLSPRAIQTWRGEDQFRRRDTRGPGLFDVLAALEAVGCTLDIRKKSADEVLHRLHFENCEMLETIEIDDARITRKEYDLREIERYKHWLRTEDGARQMAFLYGSAEGAKNSTY